MGEKHMQPLDKSLRNRLERTIKGAREVAETAARAVLEHLGVGETAPFAHLSEQDRDLRRRLRAHGRQLGDMRTISGEQALARLIETVAYEHWHRMLFARFLAENDLPTQTALLPSRSMSAKTSPPMRARLTHGNSLPAMQPPCCRRYSESIRPSFN